MFDRILNATLSKTYYSSNKVWEETFHHWGYTKGSLLPLSPNFLDLHQTQKQQDEILESPRVLISLSKKHQERKYK